MTESFGLPQLQQYLTRLGVKASHIDREKDLIELDFHTENGQWRLLLGMQQRGDERKLMLIAPHMGTITNRRRLHCLEALMSINYNIAIGKFGLDLSDGEVRLEEAVPLATTGISFEQFQLVFGAIVQTASIYHSLLPRIIYGNLSVQDALKACERDFFKAESVIKEQSLEAPARVLRDEKEEAGDFFNLDDIFAEVNRLFEKKQE